MKAYVAIIAYNLRALYAEPPQKFSRNLEKFGKFQGEHLW